MGFLDVSLFFVMFRFFVLTRYFYMNHRKTSQMTPTENHLKKYFWPKKSKMDLKLIKVANIPCKYAIFLIFQVEFAYITGAQF